MNFKIGCDKYKIIPQKTRQFHFESTTPYYAFKNGRYVSGTTSKSEEKSYSLLMEIINNVK